MSWSDHPPTDPPDSTPGPRPVTPTGILAAQLGHISARLQRTDGLDPGLLSAVDAALQLARGLDPYLSRCTTPESPALRDLAERTAAEDWSRRAGTGVIHLEQEMLSGHVEGQTLKMLVHLSRARTILEIGMFTGYSALAMAEALTDGGQVVTCEIDPDVAAFAQRFFDGSPIGHRIDVQVGPALHTLAELAAAGRVFDLVFIDADKGRYVDYLHALLDQRLLSPTGVICVDNTLLQGEPYLLEQPTANGAAIAAFNLAVADDPRVDQVMIPLRDGLTLIRWADGGGQGDR